LTSLEQITKACCYRHLVVLPNKLCRLFCRFERYYDSKRFLYTFTILTDRSEAFNFSTYLHYYIETLCQVSRELYQKPTSPLFRLENLTSFLQEFKYIAGFLFKSYPSLMITRESTEVMDNIFASGELESRTHLLRIVNSFLLSEMSKHAAAEKGSPEI
jgi:hypothetical protein